MIFKRAQEDKEQPSLFFDQWSEGNAIETPLYHGTLHDFDTIGEGVGNPNAYFGPDVIYTSDEPQDVQENYTNLYGADFVARIDNLTQQKVNSIRPPDWEEQSGTTEKEIWDKAREMVEQELRVQKPRTLKLYGKMQNPARLTPFDNPTRYETEIGFGEDEDEEGYDEAWDAAWEKSHFFKVKNALHDIIANYSDEEELTDKITEEVLTQIQDPLDFSAVELNKAIRNSGGFYELPYLEGDAQGIVAAELFQNLGHDGIIMDSEHYFPHMKSKGAYHHIFYGPHQLKSATGNSGVYDPEDKRLTASPKIFKQVHDQDR